MSAEAGASLAELMSRMVYFCPLSGQMWLSNHPNRSEQGPGSLRVRIVHTRPPWWER